MKYFFPLCLLTLLSTRDAFAAGLCSGEPSQSQPVQLVRANAEALLPRPLMQPVSYQAAPLPPDYLGQKPPGGVAELFAPGLISTELSEHSAPAFSPDGSVVLWTVMDKSYRGYLMEMTHQNGAWSTPARPSFADTTADDYYPTFSPDGKKLFFSSRRKPPAGYAPTTDIRIWEVARTSTGWGKPVPFDTAVSRGGEYAHAITKKGTFYFSSALAGGNNLNIYRSGKLGGRYTTPTLLPYSINSVGYEDGPYVSPDEDFLIFESHRPEGIAGSLDLYISFRTPTGAWGMPVNMGPKINSEWAERFAGLSPDGKYLFFGSSRSRSAEQWGFDIYWIDANVINELRTAPTARVPIAEPLGQQTIAALHQKDAQRTGALLNEWLRLYPNSLDAVVLYSSVLRKQNRYREARQLLDAQATQWQENPSILLERALALIGLDKTDEASNALAPLLVPGDQLRERYLTLSNALLDMGKLPESDGYFEKAMALGAGSFPYYQRAGALARIGENDRAFAALNKAVELKGYTSRKAYESDPSLASLKTDARWKPLMDKLE